MQKNLRVCKRTITENGRKYNSWMKVLNDKGGSRLLHRTKDPSMNSKEIKLYLKETGFVKSEEQSIEPEELAKKFNDKKIFYQKNRKSHYRQR